MDLDQILELQNLELAVIATNKKLLQLQKNFETTEQNLKNIENENKNFEAKISSVDLEIKKNEKELILLDENLRKQKILQVTAKKIDEIKLIDNKIKEICEKISIMEDNGLKLLEENEKNKNDYANLKKTNDKLISDKKIELQNISKEIKSLTEQLFQQQKKVKDFEQNCINNSYYNYYKNTKFCNKAFPIFIEKDGDKCPQCRLNIVGERIETSTEDVIICENCGRFVYRKKNIN